MKLGAYTLLEVLGKGATGVVWRAQYKSAQVAVKLLQPDLSDTLQHNLLREVDALAALNHPHIVTLVDFGHAEQMNPAANLVLGQPYVVFEYADRGGLDEYLRRAPTLSWPWLRNLLLTTLDALAHAHARNLVHRDLKPANIIGFSDPSVWKLTDFGLAFLRGEGTDENKIFGTPHYMAPEQFMGRGTLFGPHTDLYALGVMAYQLVAGRLPFFSNSLFGLANEHLNAEVPKLRPQFPVPDGLEEWIRTLLAKDTVQRFELASDAAAALVALPELMRESRISDVVVQATEDTLAMTLGYLQTEISVDTLQFGEALDDLPATHAMRPLTAPQPASWRRSYIEFANPLAGVSARLFPLRAHALVGRDRELDALWTHLVQVRRSREVKCVLVEGESGVGKTALVNEFAWRSAETGAALVVPFQSTPWTTIWSHARVLGRTESERLDVFQRLTRDLDQSELATYLAQGTDTGVTPLVTYLRVLAARRPVIFLTDDVQNSSVALSVIEALKRAKDAAILVLGTAGDADLQTTLEVHTQFSQVRLLLAPLGDLAIHEIAKNALHLEPSSADRATKLSQGSPRALFDLLNDWVDAGLELTEHGFRSVQKTVEISLDWRQRVELAVPADVRPALAWAAVLGENVNWSDWSYVCRKTGAIIADDSVALLARRGLAHWSDEGFAFANHAIRELLLPQNPAQAARVAADLLYALQLEKPKRERWPVVADLFVAAEAWGQAIAPLRYAANYASDTASFIERRRFLGLRVVCARDLGDEHLEVQAELDYRRANLELVMGTSHDIHVDDLLAQARAHGWHDLVAQALVMQAKLKSKAHDYPHAIPILREANQIFIRLGDVPGQLSCLRELADAYAYSDELDASLSLYREAMAQYQAVGHEEGIAWCHYGVGYIEQQRGRQQAALHHLEESLVFYQRTGNLSVASAVQNSIADSYFALGQYEKAWTECSSAVRAFARSGRHIVEGWANLAMSSFHLGNLERFRAEVAMVARHGPYRAHNLPLYAAVAALDRDWDAWERYMRDFEEMPKYRLVDLRHSMTVMLQCLEIVHDEDRAERIRQRLQTV